MENIFASKRRELAAKTIMNIVTVTTTLAVSSDFFFSSKSVPIRMVLMTVLVLSFWAGFFICPTKDKSEG